jgi:hypothetical protein
MAQQQANDRLIRGMPTLDQVERTERMVIIQGIKKIQHRRDRVMQRGIERQNPACHRLTDELSAVLDVYLEIVPEQLDDWQVGRCLTIGNGFGFQNQPVRCVLRIKELAHHARLAHPRFSDDSHHLAVTLAGKLLHAAKLLQFDIAADEAR